MKKGISWLNWPPSFWHISMAFVNEKFCTSPEWLYHRSYESNSSLSVVIINCFYSRQKRITNDTYISHKYEKWLTQVDLISLQTLAQQI